jgi:hypothetical protein
MGEHLGGKIGEWMEFLRALLLRDKVVGKKFITVVAQAVGSD